MSLRIFFLIIPGPQVIRISSYSKFDEFPRRGVKILRDIDIQILANYGII